MSTEAKWSSKLSIKTQSVEEIMESKKYKMYLATSVFPVPKDIINIRMVYNTSSSGLNDTIYTPDFKYQLLKRI